MLMMMLMVMILICVYFCMMLLVVAGVHFEANALGIVLVSSNVAVAKKWIPNI